MWILFLSKVDGKFRGVFICREVYVVMWRTFVKVFLIFWGRMRGREGGCGEIIVDFCYFFDDGFGL